MPVHRGLIQHFGPALPLGLIRQPISAGVIEDHRASSFSRRQPLIRSPRRPGEDGLRDCETQYLRGFQIDDQLEFGRLDHTQIGGLFSAEYPTAYLTVHSRKAWAVADQPARINELSSLVDRR
jgi:hypothetical protein